MVLDPDTPEPQLIAPTDAIVELSLSAVCGTDLHPYRGEMPDFPSGVITGHEGVGVVTAVGDHVRALRVGQRVVLSDLIACGACIRCRAGHHYQCGHAGLFGYSTVVGETAYDGCHAEIVRVPFADTVALPVPDDVPDDHAIFVGDVLSTGYSAAEAAAVAPGDVVVVVGVGPVGMLAMLSARLMGASRIIVIDPHEGRRRRSLELGAAEALAPGPDLVERLRDATAGRLADRCIEAVGNDAALLTAMSVAGPHSVIASVGSHPSAGTPIPLVDMFARELTLRLVVGDPIRVRDRVFQILQSERLDPTVVVTDRLPLTDAVTAFERFDKGDSLKVLLAP